MREILFHGKTQYNYWVEGNLTIYKNQGENADETYCDIEPFGGDMYDDPYEVIPETVGQYTGVPDNNGKLIFEGDIVKGVVPNGQNRALVVEFIKGSFCLTDLGDYVVPLMKIIKMGIKLEVIGNIHDNPEILGK